MALGLELARHPDELRADLQQYYGIDLDHAMEGGHSAGHIAALLCQLPVNARVRVANNPENAWTFEAVLMAVVANRVGTVIKALGGNASPIGPESVIGGGDGSRVISGVSMSPGELLEVLSRPRVSITEEEAYG